MATPLVKSSPSSGLMTPKRASLFVRTIWPRRSESLGNPFGSSFIFSSKGRVPITPPLKTTRSAVKVRSPPRPKLPFVSMR